MRLLVSFLAVCVFFGAASSFLTSSQPPMVVLPGDVNGEDINVGVVVANVVDTNAIFSNYYIARNYIDLNILGDVNASGSIKATNFFGGFPDVNRQFVPYVSATKDVNLNFKDLNARRIISLDQNITRDLNVGQDLNVVRNVGVFGSVGIRKNLDVDKNLTTQVLAVGTTPAIGSYGPIVMTVGGYAAFTNTADTYGRMVGISKTNYDTSTGNTKQPLAVTAFSSTGGSVTMRPLSFDVRYTGSQNQSGTMSAVYGQVYHTGTGTTATSQGFSVGLYQASIPIATNFDGYLSGGYIVNGVGGKVGTYAGFRDLGFDAEDGNGSAAYNFYGGAHQVDTNLQRAAYGLYLEKQTAGRTINRGIVLAGSGAGSDLMFGPNGDTNMSFNGTKLQIDGNVRIKKDLNVGRNLGVDGNVFADGYYTFSPYWKGTSKEALDAIAGIYGVNGKIEHSSIPAFASGQYPIMETVKTGKLCEDRNVQKTYNPDTKEATYEIITVCQDLFGEKVVGYKPTVDLGALVTMQTEAIKELKAENDALKVDIAKMKIGNMFGPIGAIANFIGLT